jgi:hypothetical protein
MAYKTILTHCNNKHRMEPLLVATVTLAEPFGAPLLGLSVVPPVAVISTGPPDGPRSSSMPIASSTGRKILPCNRRSKPPHGTGP